MNEAEIREKLLEISETIIRAGEDAKRQEAKETGLYVSEQPSEMASVVDSLRLQIKYLMFDLEACRRENRYLRQMLDMRPPQPRRDRDDGDPNSGWR